MQKGSDKKIPVPIKKRVLQGTEKKDPNKNALT